MVIARWSALIFNSILIEKLNVSITLYSLGLITFDLYWIRLFHVAFLLLLLLAMLYSVDQKMPLWRSRSHFGC